MDLIKHEERRRYVEYRKQRIQDYKEKLLRYLKVCAVASFPALTQDAGARPLEISSSDRSENRIEMTTPGIRTYDFEAHKKKMEENGRFFVNSRTGDVVYLTNDQIKERRIDAEAHLGSVSFARETGTAHNASPEAIKKAYANCDNSYLGAYQFSYLNFQNMLLFGLSQNESPEIRDLCKRALQDGIKENDSRLTAFKQAYDKSQEKMKNGQSSKLALNEAFSCFGKVRNQAVKCLKAGDLRTSKPVFKDLHQADYPVFKELTDRFVNEVYIPLNLSQNARAKVPVQNFSLLWAAEIHRHKEINWKDAIAGNTTAILQREGQNAHYAKMCTAFQNVCKKIDSSDDKYFDLSYYQACADCGANINQNELDQSIEKCVYKNYQEQSALSYSIFRHSQNSL